MEVRLQRASIRKAQEAPQIFPLAASSLPSLRPGPEMRKRVTQCDLRSQAFKCLPFGESVSAQASAWRLLRGAVQCCVTTWVPCWLVSSQFRVIGSSQAPFRCSDWPCPSCASWSHCRDSHGDQRCSDVRGRKHCSPHIQTGNRHFKRSLTLIRDLQRFEIPWILTHPLSSHIWRTAPVSLLKQHHRCHSVIFDHCAFRTLRRLRTKLIAGHCDYQDVLPLAEYSCKEHHVCAFSRRPHIQLHGKTSVGDSLQHVAKFSQALQCFHFQKIWKQMTPSLFVFHM